MHKKDIFAGAGNILSGVSSFLKLCNRAIYAFERQRPRIENQIVSPHQ